MFKEKRIYPFVSYLKCINTFKCLAQKLNFIYLEWIRKVDDKIIFLFEEVYSTGLFFFTSLPSYPELTRVYNHEIWKINISNELRSCFLSINFSRCVSKAFQFTGNFHSFLQIIYFCKSQFL